MSRLANVRTIPATHPRRRLTDSPPEALPKNLRLLHLARVDLGPDDRAEGHLGTKLLRDRERERRLPRSGTTGKEQGSAGELLKLNERGDETAGLGVC